MNCIKCGNEFVVKGQEKTCSEGCRFNRDGIKINKLDELFEEVYSQYMNGMGLCRALESVGLNRNSNRYTEFYKLCEEHNKDITDRRVKLKKYKKNINRNNGR